MAEVGILTSKLQKRRTQLNQLLDAQARRTKELQGTDGVYQTLEQERLDVVQSIEFLMAELDNQRNSF